MISSSPPSLINFRGELLKSMVQRGHRVYALGPGDHLEIGEVAESLARIGVEFIPFSMNRRSLNPIRDYSTLLDLTRILRKVNIECVLSYTPKPVVYGSLAAHKAGVESIFSIITGLGFAFSTDRVMARGVRTISLALYRLSIKHNRKVFFQNPDDLQLFLDAQILAHKTQAELVNGSGVCLEKFSPAPLPEVPAFLLIARLIAEKGIREYVAAARIVKAKHPDVKFRIVGGFEPGAYHISKSEVDAWVKEGIVEYLGTLPDVRPAIRDCAVFVLPTYYREGQPRTILEAMAMGRPIITTDNPGSRETVKDGANGFLIPTRDEQSLARAMLAFIERPGIVPIMGRVSRQIAESKYDVNKINGRMLEVMGL